MKTRGQRLGVTFSIRACGHYRDAAVNVTEAGGRRCPGATSEARANIHDSVVAPVRSDRRESVNQLAAQNDSIQRQMAEGHSNAAVKAGMSAEFVRTGGLLGDVVDQ
jgi:hypothetical protein